MPDTTIDKNPGGRPTKLTEEFLVAMMDVVNSENNALIYTDEELIFLINEQLPIEGRIDPDTFRRWKNGDISDDARAQKFYGVYKRALLKQKNNLFGKLDDPKNDPWQKDAWKIERKFTDWNIKHQISVSKPEDGAAALAAALLGQQNDPVDPAPNPTATAGDAGTNG
jgi:hypothetical protein